MVECLHIVSRLRVIERIGENRSASFEQQKRRTVFVLHSSVSTDELVDTNEDSRTPLRARSPRRADEAVIREVFRPNGAEKPSTSNRDRFEGIPSSFSIVLCTMSDAFCLQAKRTLLEVDPL